MDAMTQVQVNELSNLFNSVDYFIHSPSTTSLSRMRHQDFTRQRKLPIHNLLYFLIFRNQKTMHADLSYFFNKIEQLQNSASKQATSKALQKINPNVFSHLFKRYREYFYANETLVKKHKDYVVLAEDGTFLDMAFSDYNINYYGYRQGYYVKERFDAKKVVAKAGGLYDVTNGFFLDFNITHATASEIPLAYLHLHRVHDALDHHKTLCLLDRYYGSVELFSFFEMIDMKYCCRAKSNYFKADVASIKADGYIDITIDKLWLKRLKYPDTSEYLANHPQMRIRVVKHAYHYTDKYGKQQIQYLTYFTNLPPDEFSTKEIIDLYSSRWDIETTFKYLKVDLEMERTNATYQSVSECKMYGKIMLMNLIGSIKKTLDKELKHKITPKAPHGHRCNFNYLSACIQDSPLLKYMIEGRREKLTEWIGLIMRVAIKKIVPIRVDRHYQRYGRFLLSPPSNRFRLDGRNHPKTRKYKGGLMTAKP